MRAKVVYGSFRTRTAWYNLNKLRSVRVGRAIIIHGTLNEVGRTMSRSRAIGLSHDYNLGRYLHRCQHDCLWTRLKNERFTIVRRTSISRDVRAPFYKTLPFVGTAALQVHRSRDNATCDSLGCTKFR